MRSICQVVLPLDLGIKISEEDPVRKLVEICDGLNYKKLYSEYITGLGLFPNPADTMTLIPFLKRVQNGCGRKIQSVTADAGYASEENYTYLEENGQQAYISLLKV